MKRTIDGLSPMLRGVQTIKTVKVVFRPVLALTTGILAASPVGLMAQQASELPQLTSLFAEPAANPVSAEPMRIPTRMQGTMRLKAPDVAPKIDPAIEPPQVDVTQRRFELDAIPMLEGADVNPAHLKKVMAPWAGKELSFAEFQLAANQLLKFLRANGHPDAVLHFSRMQFRDDQEVAVAIEGLKAAEPFKDVTPRIEIAGFDVQGVTLLTPEEVDAHMAQWAGRQLTVEEIGEAAESLARLLRDQGFALAQAWLPPQEIENGIVKVNVLEGRIDGNSGESGLTIEGAGQRLKPELARAYLARAVVADEAINVNSLEEQVRLLNDLPGVDKVQTNLQPGSQTGTTQVVAKVDEADMVNLLVTADNHGSEYAGSDRLNANINFNSPNGKGEQFFLSMMKAEHSKSYKFGGHMPVGQSGLRMGMSFASMDVDFDLSQGYTVPVNIASESSAVSVFSSYPLARSADLNMDLYTSLDFKNYQNSILYGAVSNDRNINSASFGFSGDYLDGYSGQSRWGFTLTQGEVGLVDGSTYKQSDELGARTRGSFTKFNYSLQRYQALPLVNNLFFNTSINGQLASGNLDSAEKFQLGGPQGVRAWPVGEGVGDDGWVTNLELRKIVYQPVWGQVDAFGFYDIGGITQYDDVNQNVVLDGPNDYTLKGYGLGLSLTYGEDGSIELIYARKDGSNPNPTTEGTDSDGKNDKGRVWLTGKILF